MKAQKVLSFACVVASFGGAQSVRYSDRFAWVTTAAGGVVRLKRSALKPVGRWDAFYLAEQAKGTS